MKLNSLHSINDAANEMHCISIHNINYILQIYTLNLDLIFFLYIFLKSIQAIRSCYRMVCIKYSSKNIWPIYWIFIYK